MKQNQLKWAWFGVVVLMLLAASLLMQPTQVHAQATATFTATSTATNTPTSTPTPIATMLPFVYNPGFYSGSRIGGGYGIATPATSGSAYQSNVGSIDLYSAAGRHTVNIDNATGNATFYGTVSTGAFAPSSIASTGVVSATGFEIGVDTFSGVTRYGAVASYSSGTAVTHGFLSTPTMCGPIGFSSAITDAVVHLTTATTFSVTFSAGTTPTMYWLCGK